MKKLVSFALLCALMLFLFLSPAVASAETDSPYDLAKHYAETYSRRDVLSGGEGVAAKYLSAYLTARGYAVTTPSLRYYEADDSGKSVSYDYSHVIGFRDNGKGQTILLGAYYGGFEPTDSFGVGDGASVALSVGALLYLADAFSSLSCEYDLAIAFWGGMEVSQDFDVEKCGVSIGDVALYINFDCIAAGENDYLYADDLPRAQEKYFREIIERRGAAISEPPAYKKPTTFIAGSGAYSYTHLGLLGVNRFFMNEDIPCVSFLGGAWEFDCGLYRYAESLEVAGTPRDTLAEIDKANGGKAETEKRLLAVTNVVIEGVTGEGLSEALAKAEKETSGADLDSSLAFYLITFIGIALLIAYYVVLILKQGKDRKQTVWENPDRPQGSDPFEESRSDTGSRTEDPYEELRHDGGVRQPEEKGEEGGPRNDDDIFRF